MEKVDERDLSTFNELQRKMISLSEQQNVAQAQANSLNNALKLAVLTATELEKLDRKTAVYTAAGKAYFLMPCDQILQNLQTQAKANSADLKQNKQVQQGIETNMKGVQNDLKELLSNSQGLAQAFAAG